MDFHIFFQLEKLNEMFNLDYELFGYAPYTISWCKIKKKEYYLPFVITMVLILDGNSELGAHE